MIILNGFIRYRNPMIPKNICPIPFNRSMKVESSPNKFPKPSNKLVVKNAAKSNNFLKTNFALSIKVVSFSRFFGSLIHFRISVVIANLAISNRKLPIGPRNFPMNPSAFLLPFFRAPLVLLATFGFFCSVLSSNF